MKFQAQVAIEAPVERIWYAITDIENAAERIEGIQSVEILERPATGLLGLKWRETRTMFGKEATEIMWITEVTEGRAYKTQAESHGSIYRSNLEISGQDGAATLIMDFNAEPQSFSAKFLSATMGFLFKGPTQKALQKDLENIKVALERD